MSTKEKNIKILPRSIAQIIPQLFCLACSMYINKCIRQFCVFKEKKISTIPTVLHPAFFFLRFIYLFLAMPGLHCWSGFSLVAASGATLPCGGSLVGDHRIQGPQASAVAVPGLQNTGSVVAHGLSCPVACGILQGSNQGSNPHLLKWQVDSLPLSHQRSPILLSVTFMDMCPCQINK